MEQQYVPISCAVHDQLLEHATLRRPCELVVLDPDGRERQLRGTIKDVYSRDGAEYLELADGTTIRLDEILTLDGQPVFPA